MHNEVTSSLNTDSFILALWRFLSRRDFAHSILSDKGSNFLGANHELKRALKDKDLSTRKWWRLDFVAHQLMRCLSYGRGMRMPNLLCKVHVGRTVKNTQSLIEQ